MLKVIAIFSIAFVFLVLMPNSFAQEPTVKISTEKETYYYGDYFTFTIEISKIKSKDKKVNITLHDANNQEVKKLDLVLNEFGSTSGEFILPSNGLTGNYYITVTHFSYLRHSFGNLIK